MLAVATLLTGFYSLNIHKQVPEKGNSRPTSQVSHPIVIEEKVATVPEKTEPVVPTAKPAPAPQGCAAWMQAAGVTDMTNAAELIRRESGCNPNAVNRSSGACGIPQALPCSKLGTSDPVQQIVWMQNYVVRRYGSWANAINWHNVHNWY